VHPLGWTDAFVTTLRANDKYEFVPIGRLPSTRTLPLGAVDGAHGVLISEAGSGLADKVVDSAAAALVEQLRHPGRPPAALRKDPAVLVELVLDEVLEVETERGFASGPRAFCSLVEQPAVEPLTILAGRSHDIIRRVARIGPSSTDLLMARLYRSGRIPLSARWVSTFPGPDAVLSLLGESDSSSALRRDWRLTSRTPGLGWLAWSRRDGREDSPPSEFPYKLYVSPTPDALAELARPLIRTITDSGASRFKIGSDAAGLLRPDKLVVYACDAGEVSALAGAIDELVAGGSAHGVPFTAQLDATGLLSWAGDPRDEESPVGLPPESWRVAICRQLAEWIAQAQRSKLVEGDIVSYALARLELAGVDAATFAPSRLSSPAPSEFLDGVTCR
jgi:hypothetical protein